MKFLHIIFVFVCTISTACSKKTINTGNEIITSAKRTVHVSTASELKDALVNAKPGNSV